MLCCCILKSLPLSLLPDLILKERCRRDDLRGLLFLEGLFSSQTSSSPDPVDRFAWWTGDGVVHHLSSPVTSPASLRSSGTSVYRQCKAPHFFCHGDISSAATWGSANIIVSFVSLVAAAAAATLMRFSLTRAASSSWAIPACVFVFYFCSFCFWTHTHTLRETVPLACCWAGGAERCGERRCWDVCHASAGWSASFPCRPPCSSSSSSAPSAYSSSPTTSMASSGSPSRPEGACPGPRDFPQTWIIRGSFRPGSCPYEVSQGLMEWISEGPGQILWFWCLWKANILNWGRRSWPSWSQAGSSIGRKSLPGKETCPHWRTKREGVSRSWFMRTFSSTWTWTPGTESCWINTVWSMEWALLASSRLELHHTTLPCASLPPLSHTFCPVHLALPSLKRLALQSWHDLPGSISLSFFALTYVSVLFSLCLFSSFCSAIWPP